MADPTPYVRKGFAMVTAEVVVKGAQAFVEFCAKTFDGTIVETVPGSGGSIMHATLQIGDTRLFVADESPMARATQSNLYLYVRDADAVFARAVANGATPIVSASDMPWGDRWGMVRDPFGNDWQIATHREDVSAAEIARRMQLATAARGGAPAAAPRGGRDVVQSYFDCMNAGRWDEYLDLYAEDVVMDEQMAGHHEGKEHARQAIGMLKALQAMPKFHNELVRLIVDEPRVVALWHMTLVAPSGATVDCRGANYYEIRNGKISYFSNFHDTVPYLPLFPSAPPQPSRT